MSLSTSLQLLLLLLALPLPATATVAWHCWYNLDQHVACMVRQAGSAAPQGTTEVRPPQTATALASPSRTRAEAPPPSVRLLRDHPSALRGRTILIPIYTEPFDHALVAELAQAVMCGRDAACTARYGELPAMTLAEAADFADANDPLLSDGE